MVRVRVDNDQVWESVKNGEVRGFSIEGYFVDQVEKMSSKKKETLSSRVRKAVANAFKQRKMYAEVETADGKTLITESDEVALGVQLQMLDEEGLPQEIAQGTYKTQAGIELRVAEGRVVEFDGEVESEVVEEESTSAETLRSDMLTLYYKKLLEVQSSQKMSKTKMSAVRALEKWWIFMEPYNYDYRGQGFYIYPFQFGSYGKFQDEMQRMFDSYPPDAEEFENVDADGMVGLTRDGYGLDESTYKYLEDLAKWCDQEGLDIFDTYRTLENVFGAPTPDMDYLEESYQGKWKNLKEFVMYLIDEDGISDEQADRYFSFERYGRDAQSETADMEYEHVIDDGGSESEAQAAMDRIMDMRDAEVGEYIVYDIFGGIGEIDKSTKEMYLDWDQMTKDFSYDYEHVDGLVFWRH